jgi:hypothetical protein|tara:strand:+ start:238 stop:813 length:576 start_codon:yes stop_codon:yes gene_type:complete
MSTYKDLLMTLSNKGYCTSERQLSELKKELDDIYKSDEYAFLFYRTMEEEKGFNRKSKQAKINLSKRKDTLELQIMLIKSIIEKINNNDIRENHYLDRNILEDNQICYFAEVYYQINKVSANGMNRNISFFLSVDSKVVKLDFLMSKILDMKLSTNWRGGIKVRGCGMDMGFKIINDLQNTIFIKLSHRQI